MPSYHLQRKQQHHRKWLPKQNKQKKWCDVINIWANMTQTTWAFAFTQISPIEFYKILILKNDVSGYFTEPVDLCFLQTKCIIVVIIRSNKVLFVLLHQKLYLVSVHIWLYACYRAWIVKEAQFKKLFY